MIKGKSNFIYYSLRLFLLGIFLLGFGINAFGQTRVLKGVVTDSLQQPLEFTNIMAKAIDRDLPFVFAVTDEKGSFEMRLKTNATYLVTVSFMGYIPYRFKLDSLHKPNLKHIVLKPNRQALDEVVIDYKTPVKITPDSIVYNVKHFMSGHERKLKAVLQKLPGVEVSKNGQITVMGKKIQKVMVDGKDFFGGSSRLAVENIPADAVKSVQVLKDYTAVGFMKGLTDEQKMVINIKLKEGKKRFVFGDVVAGGSMDKNYLAKANLFYYSPKTNLSYIGNINDVGIVSLSPQDIRRFESNDRYLSRRFMPNPAKASLYRYLKNGDFKKKKSLFNALQWQQNFGINWQFQTYAIWSKVNTSFKDESLNHYIDPLEFVQTKQIDKQTKPETGLGKINLIFNPKTNQYINWSFYINKQRDIYTQNESDFNPFQNKTIDYLNNQSVLQWNQSLIWYHKFNKKNIIRVLGDYSYNKSNEKNNWISDQVFLTSFLNLQPATYYILAQTKRSLNKKWQTLGKYYYKINSRNHLYLSIGASILHSGIETNLEQDQDGAPYLYNDFENELQYKRQNIFTGLQYRFRLGQSIFTPGIYAHKIYWEALQNHKTKETKWLWMPEFNLETKWFNGDFSLKYAVKTNWASTEKYVERKILQSYSTVLQGNPELDHSLYHNWNLNYSYFSFSRGLMWHANWHYQRQLKELAIQTIITKMDYYQLPVLYSHPLNQFDFMLGISKEWRKYFIKYKPFFSISDNISLINNQQIISKDQFWVNDLSFGRSYKKGADFELGIMQEYISSRSQKNHFKIWEYKPYMDLNFTFKNIEFNSEFKIKYSKESDKWLQTESLFNASILYQKPDKAWGVELSIYNLLNKVYQIRYFNTVYLTGKNTTLIQGRILMLKLHYKL